MDLWYYCRMPDKHDETGQPIYFWNRLIKAVVMQNKTESSKHPHVPKKSKTHFKDLFANLLDMLQFNKF